MMSLIFGTITLVTAGAGIVTGVDGVSKIDEAQKIEQDARARYERKRESVERLFQTTQVLAHEYTQLQIQVHFQTIERFVTFVDRLDRVNQHDMPQLLAGVEQVSPQQIQQYQAILANVRPIATSCLETGQEDRDRSALGKFFGITHTETALGGSISVATLGWLGGGSAIAAGGASIAFSSVLAGAIVVAPVLAIGGFVLGRHGGKSLTASCRYEEIATTEIAKLNAFEDFLRHIQRRIIELKQLVTNLNDRAIQSLVKIESRNFLGERDAEKLQQVTLLMKTLAEVMKTPVLDRHGDLARSNAPLNAKYLLFKRPAIDNSALAARC